MLDMTLKIELIFRLFASLIAGVAIGLERENRNKDAGMKTHALVALGSAMAMVVSKYGFLDGASGDMSRIAAQVISGIGFIGAGVIFVKRDTIVRGLTTAA
ncbi:MAG TPA: MgtC/SapB family protein, partial [Erysipelothrix sp.]|nr:MgtC/SapB family protein [Erysipelothrix sp.]